MRRLGLLAMFVIACAKGTTAACLLALLTACGGDDSTTPGDDTSDNTFDECDGDPASFVRQAFLALDGRRPRSQAEVDAYVDLYNAALERGDDPVDVTARAIMSRPEFGEHWVDALMDAMHVQRLDIQTEASCWDEPRRATPTSALAQAVRDKPATMAADGQTFTMLDLARSALVLDDVTPIYRGQLFSMVSHPIPAANVGRVDAELARREDFGSTFDASFIHRDTVCLGCHNSEGSVTDSDDVALDRHWPVPGNAERAVYGVPNGIPNDRAHGAFRVDGFVDDGTTRPWGWSSNCGSFRSPSSVSDDPAGVDTKLASLSGSRTTVFDLEQSLAKGFAQLRANGAPTGDLTDPDAALAWLVTLKITEDVWTQATGTRLTIANYFPRNEAARDLLYSLAGKFVASGFSLKTLLVAVVASDYFNRLPPEAACGENPYNYPRVFDPWTLSDTDPVKQGNGPGDAVTAIDGRTLLSATVAALEWDPPPAATRFPDYGEPGCEDGTCDELQGACGAGFCCTTFQAACEQGGVLPADELPFLRGIGIFLRNSERGFRGLDFQARLAWESRNGVCGRPAWVSQDFIDRLVTAGAADGTATASDLVAALKDRLIGEPVIAEGVESEALTAIVGALDAPASGVSAATLRRVCGALVGSPQFLLQGIAGRGGERPKLTPADAGYDAVCADLAATGIGVTGRVVACSEGKVTLVDGRTQKPARHFVPATLTPRIRRGLPPLRPPAPTRAPFLSVRPRSADPPRRLLAEPPRRAALGRTSCRSEPFGSCSASMRNMMLIALVLTAGCEHTNKTESKNIPKSSEPPPDPSPGARKAEKPAEKTVPSPGSSDEVRPPTAADLAEYTKAIPGNGSKLFAKFDTSLGVINCELYPEKAPMTVANFIGLATGKKPWLNPKTGNVEKGVPYFDGLIFHRVIPGFMVQGGDPLGEGRGGPGYKFGDELSPDMDMGPLTLAMANAGPTTNGSQFFIMEDTSRKDLAAKHTIFGMCKEMDVVKKITGTPRGRGDKPDTPVTMKVTITKG